MLQLMNASVLVPLFVVILVCFSRAGSPAVSRPSTQRADGRGRKALTMAGAAVLVIGFGVFASQVQWAEWVIGVSVFGQIATFLEAALDPMGVPPGEGS